MEQSERKRTLRRRIKKALSRRFRYNPLLKILVLNAWFRAAFLLALAIVVLACLALPKVWRTSPKGFEPVVQVSGVDLIQCWSLKRSAAKAAADGEYPKAQVAWYLASGQNPSDLATVRGFLENFLNLKTPEPRMISASLLQVGWLMRMGGTNAADVVRAAKVFDKQKWYDIASSYLEPLKADLLPEAREVYLKALFHKGRIPEFAEGLAPFEGKPVSRSFELYRQAHAMGWRAGEESAGAERALLAAMDQPEEGVIAARVYLLAAAARGNVQGYEQAFQRLAVINEAGIPENVNYWMLLARQGRKAEAARMADAFASSPHSSSELIQLADAYYSLGATNSTREVLRQFLPSFAGDPEVWIYYANFLQEVKDWPELRTAALGIRGRESLFGKLWGYSYYLEGLSDHRQKIYDAAEAAFAKAADFHFEFPLLAFKVGTEMIALRSPGPALKILGKLEGDEKFNSNLEFWETYFNAAFAARDAAAVLKASEKTYTMKPRDVQTHNRYAAALMLNRRDPDESIRLTLQLVNAYPQSTAAAINHGFALLQNNRVEEARKILEGLAGSTLPPAEMNAYHLGLFEACVRLELWDKAREHASRVEETQLFPVQREWFHKLQAKMPEQIAATER